MPFCSVDSQQLVISSFYILNRFLESYQVSPLYENPAWPNPTDPTFINAVGAFQSDLPPATILATLHSIEAAFGRKRNLKNAPRTLDLDLLAYDDLISPGGPMEPVLPHPRIEDREFVLAPLCDIAPDWRSPATGKTAKSMLAALKTRTARRISL